jgi:hypothetical protein
VSYYQYAVPEDDTMPRKPTLQEIRELWEYNRRYYSALKIQQDDNHAYYNLKIRLQTPMGYDFVLPPTARTLVNDAADHIASTDPVFEVPRAKRTDKAQHESEDLNRWMKAGYHRLNENKAQPLHRTAVVHMLAKGMMALHIRFVPERLPKKPTTKNEKSEEWLAYEAKQRLAFPFEATAHDPRFVYPDPATGGQIYVFEHFMKTVGQVQQLHPEWGGWRDRFTGRPKDPSEPVEWLYYCDRYWRAYIAGSEFVTFSRVLRPGPLPHGLGFVPWVIRSAGLSDDAGLPDEKYQSMLYIVKGLMDEEMRVWSQGQAIIKDSAWPWRMVPTGAKIDPGSRKISEVPGELIDKVKEMRPDAEAPKAVLEWIEQVGAAIEKATYSSVVTGRAPSGQRSGYSVAVLAGMARVKFQPILTNLEEGLAEMMRKLLLMIENKVQEPVPIYMGANTDYVIGPSDIKGYERVDCSLDPKLVQDRAADADIGLKLYQAGLSRETLFKDYAHIENPLEEIERRMAENMLENQAVQAYMIVQLAKQRGMDTNLIQLFMQATGQLGAGQTAPGAGSPSSPGGTPAGPEQGMAGTRVPGAPPPPGTPSVPLSGPTSPMGPGGPGVLQQVAQLPRQFGNAGQLAAETPLG